MTAITCVICESAQGEIRNTSQWSAHAFHKRSHVDRRGVGRQGACRIVTFQNMQYSPHRI